MFDLLVDRRVECLSVMISMKVSTYLEIVETAYKNKGGIEGQRGKITTKTAQTIRERMVDDVGRGAVLPPVVIGYLVDRSAFQAIGKIEREAEFLTVLGDAPEDSISIIDGMQRTTALREALSYGAPIEDNLLRVEFWIATGVNALIYRMLVLNTGQVPWDIGRQLETVYGQILKDVNHRMNGKIDIFAKDDRRRRRQHSQYQSQSIIELFIIFFSRKAEVDLRDKISEDFARMDAIEATSNDHFLPFFIMALTKMTELDEVFSKFSTKNDSNIDAGKIADAKDIFNSFPAMAGFCAAAAVFIYDEPGFHLKPEDIERNVAAFSESVDLIKAKLEALDNREEFNSYLQLPLLNEKLSVKSTQVGRFEREFYKRAFLRMLQVSHRLENFEPVWMA